MRWRWGSEGLVGYGLLGGAGGKVVRGTTNPGGKFSKFVRVTVNGSLLQL